ncbi:hypothetical protein TanjilG_24936 [Lupinus angustifolius]|uniref:BHLH domain-containing protein n=1 Tax=Lupinus angustifolius TaxID=3871 RepID=A0A394DC60_LUPAN|nr:PREDICTED: transcription factor bHLH85-like [Lupinus angustifolius]OIW20858.1 hypothetical protein TanjilG_24936 [Lupinus angustifolius]
MESLGAFPDGDWDCFLRMFLSEEHDFYSRQFLDQSSSLLGEHDELNIEMQPTFLSAPEAGENETVFYSLDDHNSSLQYISQESSYSSNCTVDNIFIANNPGHTNNYFSYPNHCVLENNTSLSMDEKNILTSFVPLLSDTLMEDNINLNEDEGSERLENYYHSLVESIVLPTKRKLHVAELEALADDKTNNKFVNQKKKPHLSKDVQGCMKDSRSKRDKKLAKKKEAEEFNTRSDGHSSSSSIPEDNNASQENSGEDTSGSKSILNSNGKTRASRGSATDPQSLYARKRRERINERLKILQNLVPNGTKVDISTMLEDAVNYVKFLQLQVKLLSSDDLWMYAPLTYNGLGIGFNLNMKNSPQL